MSDKDRQKKEGRDTNKKNQQMREDEVERHKDAVPRAPESNSKGEDRGQQGKRRHPQS